jgi:hypothetical protein
MPNMAIEMSRIAKSIKFPHPCDKCGKMMQKDADGIKSVDIKYDEDSEIIVGNNVKMHCYECGFKEIEGAQELDSLRKK